MDEPFCKHASYECAVGVRYNAKKFITALNVLIISACKLVCTKHVCNMPSSDLYCTSLKARQGVTKVKSFFPKKKELFKWNLNQQHTRTNPPCDVRRREKVGALYSAVSGLLSIISRASGIAKA